jgi:hypothetical protein
MPKPRIRKPEPILEAKHEVLEETKDSPVSYEVAPSVEWRLRKLQWANGIKEELSDIVFSMAQDGANKNDIAEYFGVKTDQITQLFDEPYTMGRADLKMRIARRTVKIAMDTKMPVGVIWAGKIFNGFTETANVQEIEDDAARGVTFNVNVIKADRNPDDFLLRPHIQRAEVVDAEISTTNH